MAKSREVIIGSVNTTLDYLERRKAEWMQKFNASPAYALSWGEDMAKDAVKIEVFSRLKALLEEGVSIADIKAELTKDVLRRARGNENSTSKMSNLIERIRLEIGAELIDGFGALLGE